MSAPSDFVLGKNRKFSFILMPLSCLWISIDQLITSIYFISCLKFLLLVCFIKAGFKGWFQSPIFDGLTNEIKLCDSGDNDSFHD